MVFGYTVIFESGEMHRAICASASDGVNKQSYSGSHFASRLRAVS